MGRLDGRLDTPRLDKLTSRALGSLLGFHVSRVYPAAAPAGKTSPLAAPGAKADVLAWAKVVEEEAADLDWTLFRVGVVLWDG